jgi:ribosomal protein S18 acetylase RimI-like enzyme
MPIAPPRAEAKSKGDRATPDRTPAERYRCDGRQPERERSASAKVRQGAVRRAVARDLDRVAALWCAITEHHAKLDPLFTLRPDAGAEIDALLAAQFADPDAAVFVWVQGGDLPGFCIVRIDRAPPILAETARAEITDLGVRPAARRRGIGRALVAEATGWVRGRGVRRIEVQVASRNAEGQAFWRALGYGDLMDVLQRRL